MAAAGLLLHGAEARMSNGYYHIQGPGMALRVTDTGPEPPAPRIMLNYLAAADSFAAADNAGEADSTMSNEHARLLQAMAANLLPTASRLGDSEHDQELARLLNANGFDQERQFNLQAQLQNGRISLHGNHLQ